VTGVAVSPDGRRIVTGSEDKTARVWDARTGAELTILRGHGDAVTSVAISADGLRIVTGSEDRTAKVWDARTGAELSILKGHDRAVTGVAISQAYVSLPGRRIGPPGCGTPALASSSPSSRATATL
jgi:WD40 repeat protein